MRWVVLVLYFFHAVFGGGGRFNYVMIPNVLREYYGISYFFISWTAIIFTTVFIPCFLPIVRFVEGKSLRYITLWSTGLFLASGLLKEMVKKLDKLFLSTSWCLNITLEAKNRNVKANFRV